MTTAVPRIMTLEEFAPLVGGTFIVDCDPAPVGLKLIKASASRKNSKLKSPPFVLNFRGPVAAKLIDGAYVMRCGEWGPVLIHLSPATPPAGGEAGLYYRSVFA